MASLISVGQVLDHSLEHGRKHFKEILAIILWLVIASIPLIIGILLAPSGGDQTLTGGDWLSFILSLGGSILVIIVSLWLSATLVIAIADQASGRATKLKQIYRQGWKAFWSYVYLLILLTVIIIGSVLIAVPGYVLLLMGAEDGASVTLTAVGTPMFFGGAAIALILLVKYSVQLAFAPYSLLLEKKSPLEAIKHSASLVKGRWWSTLVRFALPRLVYFIALFIISSVVGNALRLLIELVSTSSNLGVLIIYTISLLASVFLSALITPLIIASDYYLYDSLRKTR